MPYPDFPTLGRGPHGPVATGSRRDSKPAVLTATFGDRYSQRTGDGINALPRDFAFRSIPMVWTQIEQLEAFLIERAGYRPFRYRVPGEATARQFICPAWATNYDNPLHSTITATFMENFDP